MIKTAELCHCYFKKLAEYSGNNVVDTSYLPKT